MVRNGFMYAFQFMVLILMETVNLVNILLHGTEVSWLCNKELPEDAMLNK